MFLDIKLGLAWAFLIALLFDRVITPGWIAAGIVFALLPDIDFWLEYWKRGTVGGTVIDLHRTLLHAPLTYVPMTLFIGSLYGSAWMCLFGFGVFGHFIHDSMGMGYGIRWLWPFSTRWYKLFSNKEGEILYDLNHSLASWSPEEMRVLIQDRGNNNWIKEEIAHLREHWQSIAGKLILVIIIIVLLMMVLPL